MGMQTRETIAQEFADELSAAAGSEYALLESWETEQRIEKFDWSGCGCFSEFSGYCGSQTVVAVFFDEAWTVFEAYRDNVFTVSTLEEKH